jgi:hypothetical protein
VAPPTVAGEKDVVIVKLCDGLSVVGVTTALTFKPTPRMLDMFTGALPVFVNTISLVADAPVDTLPNARFPGLALNWPVAITVPVPLIGTVTVGLAGSLVVMLKLPVAPPAAAGEKDKATPRL